MHKAVVNTQDTFICSNADELVIPNLFDDQVGIMCRIDDTCREIVATKDWHITMYLALSKRLCVGSLKEDYIKMWFPS